jgi:anthranilate synthase component 1
VPETRPALESLRATIAEARLDVPASLPPMAGGLVGYLGYDMVRQIERLPQKNVEELGVPEGLLLRPTLFAIFDNVNDELTLAAPVYPRADQSAEAAWETAQAVLTEAEAALDRPLPHAAPPVVLPEPPAPASNFSKQGFMDAVVRCKDYITAGDAFQIVVAQRFSAPFALAPFALYRALRRINPAPFLFFLDFGGFAVVGSSPEVLVRLRDGVVTIRPLAGTRRRGATYEEDQALEAELLADPKERAEHLMLLDLGRNDVGRVAALGSVKVTESFVVERFSHVMHICSNVEGRLAEGLDALDALAAGFPAGTLSGAPKVRAMEIIEELEPARRNIYAGCIGYFAANGTMDTCIGLRTALVKDGTMYVQAGAGIVADSDPEAEYEECRQKARALFRAAEEAVRFAAGKGGR